MRSGKISIKTIILAFVIVFPILPSYFAVLGVGGTNLVSLLFVLLMAAAQGGRIAKIKGASKSLTAALLVWLTCHFISMAVKDSFIQAVYFLLPSLAVCCMLVPQIRDKNFFMQVIGTIVKVSGIISIFGIIEEFSGFNVFSLLNTTGVSLNYNSNRLGLTRIISFSSHAIVYGAYLMFCLGLAFYYIQNTPSKKERQKFKFIYALLWLNLLLTFSRSVILCALLSQALLLYFSGVRKFIWTTLKIVVVGAIGIALLSALFPSVGKTITGFGYMILAVFDDSYSSLAANVFTVSGEVSAVGNRLDLYQWVFETMNKDGSWVFGHSLQDQFSYGHLVTNGVYTWMNYKETIEVQYLNLLYYYGLVGMIPEVIVYISLLVKSFFTRRKAAWEAKLGFNTVMWIILASYFLLFFAVNQSSDKNIFYLMVMLFLAYSGMNKFNTN